MTTFGGGLDPHLQTFILYIRDFGSSVRKWVLKPCPKRVSGGGTPKWTPFLTPFHHIPLFQDPNGPETDRHQNSKTQVIQVCTWIYPTIGHQKGLPNGPHIWTPRYDPSDHLGPPETP